MTRGRIRIKGAPLRGPLRVLSVATSLVFLAVLALTWKDQPAYEARAVVQIRPADQAIGRIEPRLLTRDMLEATAIRHGLTQDPALTLSQAVALHPLLTHAGGSVGLAPQTIGLIVSVRLPDPQLAVRVANDIALQAIDLGRAGQLDFSTEVLAHFRSEEDRLRQEIAALQSDPSLDDAKRRALGLMQAEYTEVRQALAREEVTARLNARLSAAPYALLARAQRAVTMAPAHHQTLAGLAAAALMMALLSALAGREFSLPSRPARPSDSGHSRSS